MTIYDDRPPGADPIAPAAYSLTGDRLEEALSALPPGFAEDVLAVVLLRPPSIRFDASPYEQIVYHACVNGQITMYIGHTDEVTMTSVYDGSVPTTIAC